MVYGIYNYSYWAYKPTYNWGASHCMVFGCLTFDMLGFGAKPCFGSSRQLFPDFFGGRPVKDGWFPQEIAMKFHHIYIYILYIYNYLYIYIYIHLYIHLYKYIIYPSRSLKLPHVDDVASKDVDEELATFYVFRDDIVMFPISYSIPKGPVSSQLRQRYGFHVESR